MDTNELILDAEVLRIFTDHDRLGIRASDVHNFLSDRARDGIAPTWLCMVERSEIEDSIDRLLENGLIKDVSAKMDYHSHYQAVGVLDRLAKISSRKDDPTRLS